MLMRMICDKQKKETCYKMSLLKSKKNPSYTGKPSSPLLHPEVVICCHVTNSPKVASENNRIISQFLWIRKLGANELVVLAQVLSGGCHQAVGQGNSPKSPGAEKFLFMLSHQVAGLLQFLVGAWTEVLSF